MPAGAGHFLGRKKVTKERRLRGRIPIPQPAKGSGTCASPPFGNLPLGAMNSKAAKCRPAHRRISEQKRQRAEKYVDSTFRTNQNTPASGGRKSKNHGFWAAFFPPFLSLLKEMGPPEGAIRAPPVADKARGASGRGQNFKRPPLGSAEILGTATVQ